MQFIAVLALLAATALAAPAPQADAAAAQPPTPADTSAAAAETTTDPDTCHIIHCALALGPVGLACVASALQEGLDPMTDLPCVLGVLNDVANTPSSCKGCLHKL